MKKILEPIITESDIKAVIKCLKETQLSGRSPICGEFEKAFAERVNVKHAIAVNSGTSALFLSLKVLGIGQNDEVIVPDFAYIAVANAVSHTGATPIFVDVEENTFNIDPTLIKITSKTKAIIAVHTYGLPCKIDELKKFGIPVIEDFAEALGAIYKKQPVGGLTEIGCCSFFANKIITTGEGGMITTNYDGIADKIRKLKDQWRGDVPYYHEGIGYGLSLNAMSCALGLSQLKNLDEVLKRKKKIAEEYIKSDFVPQEESKDCKSSWWLFASRSGKFKSEVFETRPAFMPFHLQPCYKQTGPFSNSEKIYNNVTCLPS